MRSRRFRFLWLALCLLGVIQSVSGFRILRRNTKIDRFLPVQATIHESEVHRRPSLRGSRYEVLTRCLYSVEEEEFCSPPVDILGEGSDLSREAADQILGTLTPGNSVELLYDPEQPGQAIAPFPWEESGWAVFLGGVFSLLNAGLFFWIDRGLRRHRMGVAGGTHDLDPRVQRRLRRGCVGAIAGLVLGLVLGSLVGISHLSYAWLGISAGFLFSFFLGLSWIPHGFPIADA